MTRRLLRLAAVLIAIAGVVDPALTRDAVVSAPIAIVIVDGLLLKAVDPEGAVDNPMRSAAERLQSALGAAYDADVRVHRLGWQAAACPKEGACIVVADGHVPFRLTDGAAVIGAVRVDAARAPFVAITRIDGPAHTNLNAAAQLHVELRARGARGTSQLHVLDGGAVVGEATYRWREDNGDEPAVARVPIEWIPLASGLRRLRVVVTPLQGEENAVDNEAHLAVDVQADAMPVLMYEPEATWTGTFVRRALDADPRLAVHGTTRLGPRIAVSHGRGDPLTRDALQGVNAVVISTPGLVSETEAGWLEQFVRVRGGSVVLLPDRMLAGPITRLVPLVGVERREPVPQAVGTLRAAELLTFDPSAAGVTVLESAAGRPVIVSRATGRGRVIVSGALDAWRYRDADRQFAQFWAGLVTDAAVAARPALEVEVGQRLVAPGDISDVTVAARTLEAGGPDAIVEALLRCPSGTHPVRLWPQARRGVFSGTFEAPEEGQCAVEASVAGTETRAVARVLVARDVRQPVGDALALEGAVAAHGGVVVSAGQEMALADRVRSLFPPTREPREARPMHSPLWMLPFAACLGAEWWLRRRAGLR